MWQDIAVVPFLVLLPLIENGDLMEPGQSTMSLLAALGPTALQARVLVTECQVLTPSLDPNYEPAGCAGAHRAAGARLLPSNAWHGPACMACMSAVCGMLSVR